MTDTQRPTASIKSDEHLVDTVEGRHSVEHGVNVRLRRNERRATGKALRDRVPHAQHSEWSPPASRRDPVDLVIESSQGRIPDPIPIRYGRMMASPFTFYRGTANIMAADLAATPVTGLSAQICGDCHVLNFGGFATPERRVIFDLTDFDETLPGPWKWDVKRLAVSFVFAARSNGFSAADQRDAALACVRSYREHMAVYADMPVLDVWYARVDRRAALLAIRDEATAARIEKRLKKAAARDFAGDDFPKTIVTNDGAHVIAEDPPLDLSPSAHRHGVQPGAYSRGLAHDRAALSDDRKTLLDHYRLVDISLKVVGVGERGHILFHRADDGR